MHGLGEQSASSSADPQLATRIPEGVQKAVFPEGGAGGV